MTTKRHNDFITKLDVVAAMQYARLWSWTHQSTIGGAHMNSLQYMHTMMDTTTISAGDDH